MAPAPQTAWAKPLAATLVSAFRETDVTWVQRRLFGGIGGPILEENGDPLLEEDGVTEILMESGGYDPDTGEVNWSEELINCGGAVVKRWNELRDTPQGAGILPHRMVEIWFDSTSLPIEPDLDDEVEYLERRWRVVAIKPFYGSGPDDYGFKATLEC